MITGGEGLFVQANGAATKYNQAAKNEADLINQLLNGNYLNNVGNGQGGEEEKIEGPAISNDSHVGYYADMDADGTVDGIIFADLAVGGYGQWTNEDGAYTIPVKTGLKEYYESQESYTVEGFGAKPVLSPKAETTGEDRFYIMALEDFSTTKYTWYNAVYEHGMEDYTEATSVEFGTGRGNTAKMIEYWNNKTYGEQYEEDIWGEIQGKVAEGWFVPSRAEWAAFAQELGITKTNYKNYGLSYRDWSSSQLNTDCAWSADFYYGYVGCGYVFGNTYYVRLCATF